MFHEETAATEPFASASWSSPRPSLRLVPWLRTEMFPLAPSGSPYGILRGQRSYGHAELSGLQSAIDEKAELVWTPSSTRCVLPGEIPELRSRLHALELSRVVETVRATRFYTGFYALLVPLHYAVNLQAIPRDVWLLMSFGVLPFAQSYLRMRQLRRLGPDGLERDLYGNRFNYWLARAAPRRSAHVVLISLLGLFGLQCWVGLSESIARLGLRRDEVFDGQAWRVLTGGLLHAHWLHMCLNGIAIWVYWQRLGALIGVSRLFTCAFLSVIGGSLASVAWHAHTWSVGVSGGIAGLIGYELTLFLSHGTTVPRRATRDALWVLFANASIGLFAGGVIDNAAHAGGFVTGALCALLSRTSLQPLPLPSSRGAVLFGAISAGALLAAACFVAARLAGS